MSLIGEYQQFIVLARCNEPIDETSCVPKVDIFINQAMDNHEPASHVGHVIKNCRFVVPRFIFRWEAHVTLSVMRVVSIPGSYRGTCNGNVEDVGGSNEAHRREITTVAPAVYADASWISDSPLDEMTDRGYLIKNLQTAQSLSYSTLEGNSPARRAAIVAFDDRKAERSKVLSAHVSTLTPGSVHSLNMGSAVDGTYQRIRTRPKQRRIWLVESCIESFSAIGCWKRHYFRRGQAGIKTRHAQTTSIHDAGEFGRDELHFITRLCLVAHKQKPHCLYLRQRIFGRFHFDIIILDIAPSGLSVSLIG
mmetsp:Transcript_14795/g.42602  ORF Transcript_14795/g.42602 Transcript_14795/m.42602 type:complete len:307 (-) Transcript_14795:793-1713(-)